MDSNKSAHRLKLHNMCRVARLIEDVQTVRETVPANLNMSVVSPLRTYVLCTRRCSSLPRLDLLGTGMSAFLNTLQLVKTMIFTCILSVLLKKQLFKTEILR